MSPFFFKLTHLTVLDYNHYKIRKSWHRQQRVSTSITQKHFLDFEAVSSSESCCSSVHFLHQLEMVMNLVQYLSTVLIGNQIYWTWTEHNYK
jgi:hypothetical protein